MPSLPVSIAVCKSAEHRLSTAFVSESVSDYFPENGPCPRCDTDFLDAVECSFVGEFMHDPFREVLSREITMRYIH